MEAVCFSETSVSAYASTRRYNPENQYGHLHRFDPQISGGNEYVQAKYNTGGGGGDDKPS
jgi:hypothetical protein